MALTGSTIASTYLKLLRANSDTMGADATASYIQDSADTDSALSISTTRVGIGTAAPATSLEVNKSDTGIVDILTLENTNTGDGAPALLFQSNRGSIPHEARIVVDPNAVSAGSEMQFYTDNTSGNLTLRMVLNKAGNVGIGDSNPDEAKLSITGVVSGDSGIKIDQDQNNYGLLIDSEATSAPNLIFLAPAMETGQIIEVNDANSLTTGGCAYFFSNSADNTSSRNLVTIVNENAAADKAVGLLIQQDGDDAHIEFTGAGQGGIKFTADISSSDSNTLDDYEEGTWTPGSAVGTATANLGRYTKVGNIVYCAFNLTFASTPGGGQNIISLPFVPVSVAGLSPGGGIITRSTLAVGTITIRIAATQGDLSLYEGDTATAQNTEMDATTLASSIVEGTFWYQV